MAQARWIECTKNERWILGIGFNVRIQFIKAFFYIFFFNKSNSLNFVQLDSKGVGLVSNSKANLKREKEKEWNFIGFIELAHVIILF